MKLPNRFVLTIEGKLALVRNRALLVPMALPHLLAHLFAGNELEESTLKPFGLKVTVEQDTDGGDEAVDPLVDWTPDWGDHPV